MWYLATAPGWRCDGVITMVIGGNAWVIGGDMMGLLTTSSGK